MSFWSQRFNEHSLWQTVATARSQVNEIKINPDDRESAEAMDYLGQVIELLELRRSETATERVTPNMLNAADSAVTGWSNQLANVVSGAWNPADALGGADGVQDAFASWPVLKPSRYLSGIQSATEAFVARYGEALERVSALDAASTQKLETLVEEQDDLRTKISEERDRVSELIADLKLRFDEDSKALLAEQEASFEARVRSWASRDQARAEEAETLSEQLREHEKTARSTVHATTAAVVATDYGKYARNKTLAAWICDVVAALVGAAGVAAILFHLFTLNGTADGNVGLSITRLAASLGTLGIAALIGRRGAQHHREARAAKRTDLALRRVGPFVANLPQNEREEITLELTERIFIRGDLDASSEASADRSKSRFARLRSPLRAGGRSNKPAAEVKA